MCSSPAFIFFLLFFMHHRQQHLTVPCLPATGSPCTGCGLCQSVCRHGAISMQENEEGFLSVHVDTERCMHCGACEKMCARTAEVHGSTTHEFFESWNHDAETRLAASSGGVMTALATHTLRRGGLVFGVTMDGASRPRFVVVEKEEDLPLIRGSKYAQADTSGIMQQLREAAQSKKPVLFAGVACQVRAARALLGDRYPNVLLVDLACYGTPSFHLFRAFLRDENISAQDVLRVNFRDKCSGWRSYSLSIETQQGEKYAWKNSENPFMKAFLSKLGLNACCYTCRAGLDERPGDISLGDFWGRDVRDDEQGGVSLVITHTEKGKAALEAIAAALHLSPEKETHILRANGGLENHHAALPKTRRYFVKAATRQPLTALLQRSTYAGRARRGLVIGSMFLPCPVIVERLLNKLSKHIRPQG